MFRESHSITSLQLPWRNSHSKETRQFRPQQNFCEDYVARHTLISSASAPPLAVQIVPPPLGGPCGPHWTLRHAPAPLTRRWSSIFVLLQFPCRSVKIFSKMSYNSATTGCSVKPCWASQCLISNPARLRIINVNTFNCFRDRWS